MQFGFHLVKQYGSIDGNDVIEIKLIFSQFDIGRHNKYGKQQIVWSME